MSYPVVLRCAYKALAFSLYMLFTIKVEQAYYLQVQATTFFILRIFKLEDEFF